MVKKLSPAANTDEASWLLDLATDWWDLVRFGPPGYEVYLRIRYESPSSGDHHDVEAPVMRRVLSLLEAHTSTPETAYAAVWEGWVNRQPPEAPHLVVPHREMLLFTGPVSVMRDAPALAWGLDAGSIDVEPHLVWPEDRAWLLASEVDEDIEFTIGCSAQTANELQTAMTETTRVATYGEDTPLYRV